MSARIQFKGKAETLSYVDPAMPSYRRLRIPELKNAHCDMAAFRRHAKYGSYANSDLFSGILRRIRAEVFGGKDWLRLDAVPAGVTVDETGFLVTVTFEA